MNNQINQVNHFQNPQLPYPYHVEEVSYKSGAADITLVGTLTLPIHKQNLPAVLLIAGMGPSDRDAIGMGGHKLFWVLADYLTRQGIAVLRVDKRGVGKSTGTFSSEVTTQDLAQDALAGVAYLKNRQEINAEKIGLIGFSEGGMIAPLVASWTPDVAFVVMMAAPALTDIETIVEQVGLQLRADGAREEIIAADSQFRKQMLSVALCEHDRDKAKKQMLDLFQIYWSALPQEYQIESEKLMFALTPAKAEKHIAMFNSSWYRFCLGYSPTATLKKVTVPVFALNGDCDWIALARKALPAIEQALKQAGNQDYMVVTLPQLNHQFQTCQTGALAEYAQLEETIAPIALQAIASWIAERV